MRQPRSRVLWVLLALVIVLTVAGFLGASIFRVRLVEIEGASTRTSQEILRIAGIEEGTSIFKIHTDTIQHSLEQDPYLQLVEVKRVFPSTVKLIIKERAIRAVVDWMGALVVLDEEGIVLDIRTQLGNLDIPFITGMYVRSYALGTPVETEDALQLEAMQTVLNEMKRQQIAQDISEVNLENLQNIYLITRDGRLVRLGNVDQIEKKIQLMRAVLPVLEAENRGGGTVDVSSARTANYIPPQVPSDSQEDTGENANTDAQQEGPEGTHQPENGDSQQENGENPPETPAPSPDSSEPPLEGMDSTPVPIETLPPQQTPEPSAE